MLTIRTADEADADFIRELADRTFSDTFVAANDPATFRAYVAEAFAPARVAAELADPSATFLLAESDGAAIAYAKLLATPPDAFPEGVTGADATERVRFYVAKEHHGAGVAHQLMQAVIDTATAAGHRTMFLGVWEENPRAIAFYRKWNFTIVGIRPFMLGDDPQPDHVMMRVLG